ncbi:glycoside hydrolase family 2 TIM barrel-domain containing protein [Leifsonia sp. F6_8S_P_1B]|uniref:beta-mannosidase n=1 Tax=Leifsonia williamsii TaxID=3035919 RepID=A0ABT8KA57_9MICO|nr:glycoside hydrolase family 2 TIM barrel-domain containing protein [Leifsonia williamsii]MDN4613367.1 glycoside hydrolase family 2 TIM barrel-domain containing protein [Leifsonia williamsii]
MRASTTITVDGDGWTVREALGDTAEWYLGAPLPVAGNNVAEASAAIAAAPGWLPATVPGSVIDDLHRAGEVPDPRVGRNSRASEWVAERSWVYRRAVEVPAGVDARVALLEFDGVDPGADVYWDGDLVGSIDGLYRRGRFELTAAQTTPGRHKLALHVLPAPASEPQVGRTERVRVHAPRLGYGWDFSPRLRHQGIWRSARLRFGDALLREVEVRARVEPQHSAEAVGATGLEGVVEARWEAPLISGSATPASRVTITVMPETKPNDMSQHAAGGRDDTARPANSIVEPATAVAATGAGAVDAAVAPTDIDGTEATATATEANGMASATVTAPTRSGTATLRLPSPALWHPNTAGSQPLYRVTVTLTDADGRVLDSTSRLTGFRTAELVRNEGAPADARGYTAVVNGTPVAMVGWNWTPADTLFGAIRDETVEHLLGLAAASGARMVRVWGGGLIESEHFYETCDRLGLLVWQEFSQSSSGMQSAPSTDPAFVALMREEAEAIVPTRVHHPSLLVWGGGNELDEGGVPLDDTRSPVLAALHETVEARDPGRSWLPTSPTGPEFHNRLDRIRANPGGQHDVHGPWEHQGLVAQYELYNAGTNLAHSEFGVEGMTNLRSLEALIPEPDRWPADRTNPVYRHLGEWWNNATQVNALFGARPRDLETLNRASQLLQATGLQYAVEADRRRWPRNAMVLPWQLNESFPNAWCTAAVDYRGEPKPAFHAVARAFERRRATLRVTRAVWAGEQEARVEAWLWAEDPVAAGSTVTLRVRGLRGEVLAEERGRVEVVDRPVFASDLAVPVADLPEVFLWEAEWRDPSGAEIDVERMIATTTSDFGALFDVPQTTLEVEAVAGSVRVRNVGGAAALTVRVVDARPAAAPGWLLAGGDPRPLLPGEERTLTVGWSHAQPGPARLESWNAPPLVVAPQATAPRTIDPRLPETHRVGSRPVQNAVVQ